MPAALSRPIVCYVSDRSALGSSATISDLLAKIRAAIAAGSDWIQIREKDMAAREMLDLTRAAVAIAQEESRANAAPGGTQSAESTFARIRVPARILVNDRLDVALAAGAGGVHLGRASAPATEVVRWLRARNAPPEFVVGVSCHSLEEAQQAEIAGANYVFFGPVFDSPSKRPFGAPQGIARLAEVCHAAKLPVLAIGGVNEENAGQCLDAGASGIAAIRLFQQSESAAAPLKATIARLHRFA